MVKDESKIIKFGDYCQKYLIKETKIEEVTNLAAQTVGDVINFLDSEGYNIEDPQFRLDMEAVYVMLQAAMCRQKELNSPGIKLLDFIEDDQPA